MTGELNFENGCLLGGACGAAAVCCSVLRRVAVCCSLLQCAAVCLRVVQCVAVFCIVVQCVAVCCSVLQCVKMTTDPTFESGGLLFSV